MKKIAISITSALFAMAAAPAFAELGNAGQPMTDRIGQHRLSTPEGVGTILYAPSEGDDPGLRSAISQITGATVDYFDARAGTPDPGLLESYDCVYTWTNFPYEDNTLFGDRLADYVDTTAGKVVLGVFTSYTAGSFLSGRIMDEGYAPVTGGQNHFITDFYAGDGVSILHNEITAYSCTFRDILTLQGAGVQDGSYTNDGEIAAAFRPDLRVVYSNGSGAIQLGCGGQWAGLVANACGFPCQISTRLSTEEARPGDTITADIVVTHHAHSTVRVPFTVEILNEEGDILLSETTRALHMDHGDQIGFARDVVLPKKLTPGVYRLVVTVDEMAQGRVRAMRAFRIVE